MWRDAYLESRVLAADPVELIDMLYERATNLVSGARISLAAGDIAARCHAISTSLAILCELESSLNHQAGGEISKNLGRLYTYMRNRLVTANLMRQDAPLAEVETLLKTLADGWKGMRSQEAAPPNGAIAMAAGSPAPDRWGSEAPAETVLCGSGEGWKA